MFQFQCPNGHLLEGDESQAGQQCTCPMCNTLFIIPQPLGAAPGPTGGNAPPSQFPSFIGTPGGSTSGGFSLEQSSPAANADPMAPVAPTGGTGFALGGGAAAGPEEPKLYHIPCPNGHELEVPEDMLRQDVLCPYCEAQFHLRLKDSVEYKKQQAEEQERKDRKAGKAWLHWSIAIGAVVLLTLLGLIIYDATRPTPPPLPPPSSSSPSEVPAPVEPSATDPAQ